MSSRPLSRDPETLDPHQVRDDKNGMKINIKHIAQLANLPLTEQEEKKFEKQLSETLTYVDQLNEVATEGIKPTDHVTGLENVFRDDVESESLSQSEATKNAKNVERGFFKVAAIFED